MAHTRYTEVLNKGVHAKIAKASDELFIAKLLTTNTQTRHVFRGTFAVNERVTQPVHLPAAYIYNTYPRHTPTVGHWICMYVYRNKYNQLCVEFFGSFGLQPPDELLTMARQWTRHVIWNRKFFQHYTSALCGMYCVYYLHYRCFGWSMAEIQRHFSVHTLANDKLVQDSISAMVDYS